MSLETVQRLLMGAWATQSTFLVARLGLPDLLLGGPRRVGELAGAVDGDPDALRRLCRAAATVGLLTEVDGDRYALTDAGRLLAADTPGSMRAQALAFGTPVNWRLCGDLGRAVSTGRSTAAEVLGGSLWDYYARHPDEGELFSQAMGEQSARAAADVAAAVTLAGSERIADIGGAHGDLLTALLAQAPDATGVLVDLPPVIESARARLTGTRVEPWPGDFFAAVPSADLYLLKWILHDWDDERAIRILANCRRAAASGARLLVVEMLVPEPWRPSPVHLYDLAMLVLLGSRERTAEEYAALLDAAGWRLGEVTATRGAYSVLQACTV
ncbi:methyltransferase [Actinoplanes sp. NPDC051513]|uniref:methyltransferase n=1 Tax=Actinoplanes sp. NPDC051513 TaxID=3363908 RepID=UPI00379A7D75